MNAKNPPKAAPKIPPYNERKWLISHGKKKYIDFTENEIKELRRYFSSLDGDGSGKIDIDELEEPLIAFGLCETREEVINMIKQVDLDGNGTLEFDEFLLILKNAEKVLN